MKNNLTLELYKKMYLIRSAEEQIRLYYNEDEMKTPMHMSMGEEAIAAGVCQALKGSDQIFTTYRSHAGFLCKTGEVNEFFAEMYAKDSSSLKGKGGSMHLCSPAQGFMGTSAIVSAHIPVAMGCAWANKMENNKKVVAVFFGDGAIDEGVFWESLNSASLMELPVIFVCEDNGLAVHTQAKQRRGYDSITRIVDKFRCKVVESDSTDAEVIYKIASRAVNAMRKDPGPCFMNFKYYRYLEHVGINYDFDAGYRSKKEFDKWLKVDPIAVGRKKLIKSGMAEAKIKSIEDKITKQVITAINQAKSGQLSGPDELYKGVFQ